MKPLAGWGNTRHTEYDHYQDRRHEDVDPLGHESTAAPVTTTTTAVDLKLQEYLLVVQGHDDGMTDAEAIRAGRRCTPGGGVSRG